MVDRTGLLLFHFVCRQLNCKLLSDCCPYYLNHCSRLYRVKKRSKIRRIPEVLLLRAIPPHRKQFHKQTLRQQPLAPNNLERMCRVGFVRMFFRYISFFDLYTWPPGAHVARDTINFSEQEDFFFQTSGFFFYDQS